MKEKIIIIGASGHGKVIADIIRKSGDEVIGFLDDHPKAKEFLGSPILGTLEDLLKFKEKKFFIAIGDNHTRKKIAKAYPQMHYYTAIHPTATIGEDVKIEEGTCVMAGAIINPSTQIGKHVIINTGAILDHDNHIEDFVHISPRAVLAGNVHIGELTHIGVGATIKNNLNICGDCVIGAGGVVVKEIKEKGVYIGIPVKNKE